MNSTELLNIIKTGENSTTQFKANFTNIDAVASELVAFSNSYGGQLIIGVYDNGSLSGLTTQDIARINQLISNAASQSVRPAINPKVETLEISDNLVMVVSVEKGISRPYMDNHGVIWVKNGADKRKVTAREELQRMFQQERLIHADEIAIKNSTIDDIDIALFDHFFETQFGEPLEKQTLNRETILKNMNLMTEKGELNIAGMLLFGKYNHFKLPLFSVRAVAFEGISLEDEYYIDSQEITGNINEMFRKSISFILGNIRHIQNGQNVNSVGEPEIPRIVFEELMADALVHRDYFSYAPIKLFIFKDRVEIISPGHLPNNLSVENIKYGNSNPRNPILTSYANKLLPYRGIGSGIVRALKAYPLIEFMDDRKNNQFKVKIERV